MRMVCPPKEFNQDRSLHSRPQFHGRDSASAVPARWIRRWWEPLWPRANRCPGRAAGGEVLRSVHGVHGAL